MRAAAVLGLLVCLGACSTAHLAKGVASAALGGGGGPSASANIQAGKSNAQALQSTQVDQRLDGSQARTIEQSAGETGVRAEAVQTVTVRNEAPPWVWLLLIAGWVLPAPAQIARQLRGAVSNRKKGAVQC